MSIKLFYSGPSLRTLHEDYAKKGRIDSRAAVQASYEALIDAPVAEVWAILADPANWGHALPAIHAVHLTSGVTADAPFTWKNGNATMKSRFAVVRPLAELTWSGTSMGFKAIHQHILREASGGATLLQAKESMSGPLLTLFFPAAKLQAALSAWVDGIKRAAEDRQPGSSLLGTVMAVNMTLGLATQSGCKDARP
jgi:hypothetical protein